VTTRRFELEQGRFVHDSDRTFALGALPPARSELIAPVA
jgi:hypothetical protein